MSRLQKALRALSREPRLDYYALYPAVALKDHGDMHLDLRPDDARLPDMVRVPLRLFLPGAYVRVRSGARVLLGFEAANPARPVAQLWERGALTVLEITSANGHSIRLDDEQGIITLKARSIALKAQEVAFGDGPGQPVARVGDPVWNGSSIIGTIKDGSRTARST